MYRTFATDYTTILEKINLIDPIQYGQNRNYIDGSVSYLSPYISRGIISTKQVLNNVLAKGYKVSEIEHFVKELCWRDYFQRVAQFKNLNQDIKQQQEPVLNKEVPEAILNGSTGIEGIDNAIKKLYETGYMHNHCRMYTASVVCNIAKSHWFNPAQWMYFHLLDGDWASNACSWQWVAGSNSTKKYYVNQDNINKYTHTNQLTTFLNKSYEEIKNMETPTPLSVTQKFAPEIKLPASSDIKINTELPTYIYNYYNLDPLWHKEEEGNRILLIEDDFFKQYPVSEKCMDFMLAASKNIVGIQVYVGSFKSLTNNFGIKNIHYKEHPHNSNYFGNEEPRDWITDAVKDYYPSFFSYWKKAEAHISHLK